MVLVSSSTSRPSGVPESSARNRGFSTWGKASNCFSMSSPRLVRPALRWRLCSGVARLLITIDLKPPRQVLATGDLKRISAHIISVAHAIIAESGLLIEAGSASNDRHSKQWFKFHKVSYVICYNITF